MWTNGQHATLLKEGIFRLFYTCNLDICGDMLSLPAVFRVNFFSVSINIYFRNSKGQCGQCLYGQKLESPESGFKMAPEATAGLLPPLGLYTVLCLCVTSPRFCSVLPAFSLGTSLKLDSTYISYNKML